MPVVDIHIYLKATYKEYSLCTGYTPSSARTVTVSWQLPQNVKLREPLSRLWFRFFFILAQIELD
jgi:hypothetical protein